VTSILEASASEVDSDAIVSMSHRFDAVIASDDSDIVQVILRGITQDQTGLSRLA
jgi:hypothetical protein